ncbi:MAG: hypothetical protein H3C69_06610 [Candidatus Promineofilum sp.]|nr:hypothetical protein [Promineifilum sp.]
MDFVYCPNGHANRPGTRICAVCRSLIQPPPVAPPPLRNSSILLPAEPSSAAPEPETELVTPRRNRNRLWVWLLLLAGLLGALALVIWAFFYLPSRTQTASPTPARNSTVAGVALETSEPPATDLPLPTATVETLSTSPPTVEEPSPTTVFTITPLSTIVGVVITPTFSFDSEANLLQNGDFARGWADGWVSITNGRSSLVEVRPVDDEPNMNAIHLEQDGAGYLKVAQRVVLTYPIEGLVFRARVRAAGTSNGDAEGRGMLILQYEGADGEPVGASIWLDGSSDSTELWDNVLSPSLTMPFVRHSLDEGWQDLTIDLGREFADELAGLSPLDVFQLTVTLAVANSDTCRPGNCEATLDVTGLSLAPRLP